MAKDFITLAHGSGGKEMEELIRSLGFSFRGEWRHFDNDAAALKLEEGKHLCFTTDSFVVDPIFFPGGNIGHLAFSGTVNDLCVMGAKPLGISLAGVIEEGFPIEDLNKIISSIKKLSEEYGIPIVTGDTKVMEKGKIDKMIINTSGVGMADDLLDKKAIPGDRVILSGGLGEHAVALLSKRFDFKTDIVTDSKPLVKEMEKVKRLIRTAKDPTRGGLAAVLNEIASRNSVGIEINEDDVPAKPAVKKAVEMLGINIYELASEGRLVCVASEADAGAVLKVLKEFNPDAAAIGEVVKGDKVVIKTALGSRILPVPSGRIVPRIC